MKFIAYVTKCVPVEVEVDDKWKPMEEYGNTSGRNLTNEQSDYFDANIEDFLTEIEKKLAETDEYFSHDDLGAVWTMEDNYITEL